MASIMHAVIGERGEYSDWTIWIVAVYLTEDQAKAHAEAAQKWIDAMPSDDWDDRSWEARANHVKTFPFDESVVEWSPDDFGTYPPKYSVRKVLCIAHLDEYQEQDSSGKLPNGGAM